MRLKEHGAVSFGLVTVLGVVLGVLLVGERGERLRAPARAGDYGALEPCGSGIRPSRRWCKRPRREPILLMCAWPNGQSVTHFVRGSAERELRGDGDGLGHEGLDCV